MSFQTIREGDAGERVSDLQRQLSVIVSEETRRTYLRDDINRTDVDGIYGPRTVIAVTRFQREHDLEPTGICDAVTWEVIGKAFDETEIEL